MRPPGHSCMTEAVTGIMGLSSFPPVIPTLCGTMGMTPILEMWKLRQGRLGNGATAEKEENQDLSQGLWAPQLSCPIHADRKGDGDSRVVKGETEGQEEGVRGQEGHGTAQKGPRPGNSR